MKTILSLLFISTIAFAGEWKDISEFKYQSKALSCSINKQGAMTQLKTPESLVFTSALLYGIPLSAKGERYKNNRITQNVNCTSMKIKDIGNNSCILTATGILSNKSYPFLAEYTQKIIFTPVKISFYYEIVCKKALSLWRWNPFMTIAYAPCRNFRGLGYVTGVKPKRIFSQFPVKYDKSIKLNRGKNMRIIFPDCHIIFKMGENTNLSILDGRAWKNNNFRFNFKPFLKRKVKIIKFKVDSKLKWSYSINFEDK